VMSSKPQLYATGSLKDAIQASKTRHKAVVADKGRLELSIKE